jgi:hypothetical protein
LLKEKSVSLNTIQDREWQDKQKRREEGKGQLEEYLARKEEEKLQRSQENLRK